MAHTSHILKTWPKYFERIISGHKTFEVRKADRDFQVGDFLTLKEYDPETTLYTGRQLSVLITYILHGPGFGIEEGYCVMAINIDE